MWPPYLTMHHAKNANAGLWPKDLTKVASHNPGNINYPYNLLTGYHYNPPFGLDVAEGRYFNPYYDHMIIGMPPQLHDGMIEYDDGTPASAPQMAHDVSEYLSYIYKSKYPDERVLIWMGFAMFSMFYCVSHLYTRYHYVNLYSYRFEVYAVKNGGYKKFRQKMWKTHKIPGNWSGQFS